MSDNNPDVILITKDNQLREVLARERPPSVELQCLSPEHLRAAEPPRTDQWWVDLDCWSAPGVGDCRRRVYFYSQVPDNMEELPAGVFLRKPCAVTAAADLWAGVTAHDPQPESPADHTDTGNVPVWVLELLKLDLRDFCHACVKKSPARLGYIEAAVYLYDAERDMLTLAETNCKRRIDLAIPLDPTNDHLVAAVARSGRCLITTDLAEAARARGQRCPADVVGQRRRQAVIAPLISGGELCGLLRFSRQRRDRSAGRDLMLEPIFAFLARGLKHARQHLQARIEARVDRLTGLFNYRWMIEALGKEIQRTQRYGSPLALIMLDLDGLKTVNDKHGHIAGDGLLRHCAGKIMAALRQTDSAARIGGDEFVVLLPATELDGAHHVAQRALAAIRTDAPLLEEKPLTVTASVGVAQWRPGWGVQELIQAADKAMYLAKHEDRNCVVCHPHASPAEGSSDARPRRA